MTQIKGEVQSDPQIDRVRKPKCFFRKTVKSFRIHSQPECIQYNKLTNAICPQPVTMIAYESPV
ncbi:hypothetical protein C7B65_00575 [Phormidesmis priestleyi ULC007]|uniref:Uncharacterized protein n=1 Tax=Phormidesmis priestleyi ULC007 TaxID=1920490 RepID=A0A2T1DNA7_9CYAN|nr:hypothetical protein C7B65_00575 [Phormidesmis priestleyi ULC007]PZO55082.1 MAG: hypothetical protein DCF14_01000 [Phormidesmis priestleyi]